MDNKETESAYQAHGLPTAAIRVRIDPAHSQRVIENKLSRFKAQAVIALVGSVLFFTPNLLHAISFGVATEM